MIDELQAIADQAHAHWSVITGTPRLVVRRENAVFKVETNHGTAALRVHRKGYHNQAEIESELQWMAHLAQCGIVVPQPFATNGGPFLAQVQDHDGESVIVDLLSWLEGDPLGNAGKPLSQPEQRITSLFFTIGAKLAKLHMASDAWAIPADFKRHALDRDGLVGERPAWGRFWDAACLTSDEQQLMRQTREHTATFLDGFSRTPLDYGLIHADLVPENILINGSHVSFIDFDDAGYGFRSFDLAVALSKHRAEPAYAAIRRSLISGYRSERHYTSEDERAIDVFIAMRDLALLGWVDERSSEPETAARVPRVRAAALASAQWLLNQ